MRVKYIHFTDLAGAKAIKESGELLESSFGASGIFAVAIGGYNSPGVQQTKGGRPKNRKVAVVFKTSFLPDVGYPEEVIWHNMASLPVEVVSVIPAKTAESLLDGSIPEDPETEKLQIPLQLAVNDMDSGWTRMRGDALVWTPGKDNKKFNMVQAIWRKWKDPEKVTKFWTGQNILESIVNHVISQELNLFGLD